MSYRINTHPKPHGNRTVIDTTTPARFFITNGSAAEFAIPCWYQIIHKPLRAHVHNRHLHRHQGWPSPDHPDHTCQLWIPDIKACGLGYHRECSRHCEHYVDMSMLEPIHLLDEGYDENPEVTLLNWDGSDITDDAVSAYAYIGEDQDWVIRVRVSAKDSKAIRKPVEYKMAVRARRGDLIDTVVVAKLVVMPAAYDAE